MKPFHTSELYQLMNLDRNKSNAALFSACYESTLDKDLRRSAGMHYTSVENTRACTTLRSKTSISSSTRCF